MKRLSHSFLLLALTLAPLFTQPASPALTDQTPSVPLYSYQSFLSKDLDQRFYFTIPNDVKFVTKDARNNRSIVYPHIRVYTDQKPMGETRSWHECLSGENRGPLKIFVALDGEENLKLYINDSPDPETKIGFSIENPYFAAAYQPEMIQPPQNFYGPQLLGHPGAPYFYSPYQLPCMPPFPEHPAFTNYPQMEAPLAYQPAPPPAVYQEMLEYIEVLKKELADLQAIPKAASETRHIKKLQQQIAKLQLALDAQTPTAAKVDSLEKRVDGLAHQISTHSATCLTSPVQTPTPCLQSSEAAQTIAPSVPTLTHSQQRKAKRAAQQHALETTQEAPCSDPTPKPTCGHAQNTQDISTASTEVERSLPLSSPLPLKIEPATSPSATPCKVDSPVPETKLPARKSAAVRKQEKEEREKAAAQAALLAATQKEEADKARQTIDAEKKAAQKEARKKEIKRQEAAKKQRELEKQAEIAALQAVAESHHERVSKQYEKYAQEGLYEKIVLSPHISQGECLIWKYEAYGAMIKRLNKEGQSVSPFLVKKIVPFYAEMEAFANSGKNPLEDRRKVLNRLISTCNEPTHFTERIFEIALDLSENSAHGSSCITWFFIKFFEIKKAQDQSECYHKQAAQWLPKTLKRCPEIQQNFLYYVLKGHSQPHLPKALAAVEEGLKKFPEELQLLDLRMALKQAITRLEALPHTFVPSEQQTVSSVDKLKKTCRDLAFKGIHEVNQRLESDPSLDLIFDQRAQFKKIIDAQQKLDARFIQAADTFKTILENCTASDTFSQEEKFKILRILYEEYCSTQEGYKKCLELNYAQKESDPHLAAECLGKICELYPKKPHPDRVVEVLEALEKLEGKFSPETLATLTGNAAHSYNILKDARSLIMQAARDLAQKKQKEQEGTSTV